MLKNSELSKFKSISTLAFPSTEQQKSEQKVGNRK